MGAWGEGGGVKPILAMPVFSRVFRQPPLPNPGEPRVGGGPEAWRGRERADQYLSLLSGSQEKEVGKQKICSMIRREIQLPEQLILRVSRSWRYCNGRPTHFESEPILAVLQCQANLTKRCAFPDHIRPFGHRKRIFGGLSVSF